MEAHAWPQVGMYFTHNNIQPVVVWAMLTERTTDNYSNS
jgi:hypothetical protein